LAAVITSHVGLEGAKATFPSRHAGSDRR